MNIPEVKLGIIAVSRDCFPIALSTQRRKNIAAAYGEGLYECPVTVENEADALKALDDVKAHGVNALVVFLGNFGPETPETILCQKFDGPTMYVAAAEGDGDLINGRGDAYCGMLNCSYNLGMRRLKVYLPEYPVGTAEDCARMIRQYVAFADKCWPAFPEQFGFEPCYVNSRLASRGIPVACEVDIYGALSEYIYRRRRHPAGYQQLGTPVHL